MKKRTIRLGFVVLATLLAATVLGLILWVALGLGDVFLAPAEEPVAIAPDGTPMLAAERAVGREAWEAALAEGSGSELSLTRVVELAEAGSALVEARLDLLAGRIDPEAGDWRPVFAVLAKVHPREPDEVVDLYREITAEAEAFFAERSLVPLPAEPPVVRRLDNRALQRSFPLAVYLDGRSDLATRATLGVTTAQGAGPDPGYLDNHCRVCIPPLVVHETYPGHHVAFRQLAAAGAEPGLKNAFFHEGWGQYAEILALEEGFYDAPRVEDPAAAELGAWRLVLYRAERARIDALLHDERMTPEEAVEAYREGLLVPEAAARAEVERHLQDPTMKTSYWVGMLQILTLRQAVLDGESGEDAALEQPTPDETGADERAARLADFHRRFLVRDAPVPEIARDVFEVRIDGPFGRDLAPFATPALAHPLPAPTTTLTP